MEGFLPPKPAGPEPEIGGRPARELPPPAQQQPQQQPQHQPQPDNAPAVAGFVFSLVAAGLLFVTAGLSSVISLACAVTALVYARKGRQNVASGLTDKHRSLAQAAWVLGWIGVVLSLLSTLAWIRLLTDEELRRELELAAHFLA